jgi:hypothetical protein
MASPNLIASYQVLGGATTLSLSTGTFFADAGEVIIVKAASESFEKPTITGVSGGDLIFTSHVNAAQANFSPIRLWSAVVETTDFTSVTTTFGANDGYHSMVVERWGNAQLAGSPAIVSTTSTGAPSANIVTVAAGSAVSWVSSDWNAVAPGVPAYRSGAVQSGIHDQSTSFYVAYYAYQITSGSGSQTIGLTSPAGQKATMGGIEIQGVGGGSPPTVTTQPVTNITGTTATGNGTVVADGGDTITERGVCWSTSLNPTTSDSKATSAGTTGSYTASITGLSNGTLYHVRAYAINGAGTSYGSDVTFTVYSVSIGWLRA